MVDELEKLSSVYAEMSTRLSRFVFIIEVTLDPWLRKVDQDGSLDRYLKPCLLPGEYHVARLEGWILGVM